MKRGLAAVAAAGLVACGGGGGDDAPPLSAAPSGPPAAAAAMGTTADDAVSATKTAVAVADGMAARKGALAGLSTALGVPVSGGTVSPLALPRSGGAGMKRALAVSTDPCTAFFDTPPPCSGTITTDTDILATATRITRGQYLDGTFNALSGTSAGEAITLSGRLRAEFLTDFDFNTPSFSGFGLRLVLTGFSGTLSGAPFGPLTETMDLTIDRQGVPVLVTAGARFGSLAGVRLNGPGTYTIGTGTGRVAYGGTGPGYADVSLNGWTSSAGRPAAPSQADVFVPGVSASVRVVAAGAGSVSYEVILVGAAPGNTGRWRVSAVYPGGSAAPVYSTAPL